MLNLGHSPLSIVYHYAALGLNPDWTRHLSYYREDTRFVQFTCQLTVKNGRADG